MQHRLVCILGIALLAFGCRERDVPHHFATLLDTPTRVGPDWIKLSAPDSLVADRDNNCLVITLAAGYRPQWEELHFVDSTGRDTAVFAAELVLTDGQRHLVTNQGIQSVSESQPTALLCDVGSGHGRRHWFRAVYLRALHAVSVQRIEWQSADVSP